MTTTFALQWPEGRKRTPSHARAWGSFDPKRSRSSAVAELLEEIRKLGGFTLVFIGLVFLAPLLWYGFQYIYFGRGGNDELGRSMLSLMFSACTIMPGGFLLDEAYKKESK